MTAPSLAGLHFHHLGLALKDEGQALKLLEALGYRPGPLVHDPLQKVKVRLCTAPDRPAVELVLPPDEGPSPVDSIVARYGEMIYHTCYETDDLAATLAELKVLGLKVLTLSPSQPAVLFGGRHVSFHRVQGFGILEFLEPG